MQAIQGVIREMYAEMDEEIQKEERECSKLIDRLASLLAQSERQCVAQSKEIAALKQAMDATRSEKGEARQEAFEEAAKHLSSEHCHVAADIVRQLAAAEKPTADAPPIDKTAPPGHSEAPSLRECAESLRGPLWFMSKVGDPTKFEYGYEWPWERKVTGWSTFIIDVAGCLE